jgi:copper(I)-binding protein
MNSSKMYRKSRLELATPLVRAGYLCLLVLLLPGCSDDSQENIGSDNGGGTVEVVPVGRDAIEQIDPPPGAEGLVATDAYLRQPAPGQSVLAAFVTFENTSNYAYTLKHISSPRAESIKVHNTLYEDGVMSMRPVAQLVVPPQSELTFKPGGYHLMLSGLEGTFSPGDAIPLSFSFEGGTTLEVTAEVRAVH